MRPFCLPARTTPLALCLSLFLGACASPAAGPAGPAGSTGSALVFADFGQQAATSNQGAEPWPLAYAERRGDAWVISQQIEGDALTVRTQVGNARGSQWGGAGISIAADASAHPQDLSAYKSLRVRLAATGPRVLRLRLVGQDERIANLGCYPMALQAVGPEMQSLEIPLSRFQPEAWCGENMRRVRDTLPQVRSVEVVDMSIRSEPGQFRLGTIEFLR